MGANQDICKVNKFEELTQNDIHSKSNATCTEIFRKILSKVGSKLGDGQECQRGSYHICLCMSAIEKESRLNK